MDWNNGQAENDVEDFLSFPITAVPEPFTLYSDREKKVLARKVFSNIALIRLPESGILFLVTLFNMCLILARFSKKWQKVTSVIRIRERMLPMPTTLGLSLIHI